MADATEPRLKIHAMYGISVKRMVLIRSLLLQSKWLRMHKNFCSIVDRSALRALPNELLSLIEEELYKGVEEQVQDISAQYESADIKDGNRLPYLCSFDFFDQEDTHAGHPSYCYFQEVDVHAKDVQAYEDRRLAYSRTMRKEMRANWEMTTNRFGLSVLTESDMFGSDFKSSASRKDVSGSPNDMTFICARYLHSFGTGHERRSAFWEALSNTEDIRLCSPRSRYDLPDPDSLVPMPHSYCSAPLKDESRLRTIGRATLARSKQPLVTGFLEKVCGSKKLERFLCDDPTADERLETLKDTVGIPKPPSPYKYGQYRAEINNRLGYTGNSYAAHVRLRVPLEPLYIVMVKETGGEFVRPTKQSEDWLDGLEWL